MTYRSNNIFAQNSMLTFLNTLENDMINVGWVKITSKNLVSNASNQAQSVLWDVLQSPAANNGIGNNWYIALGSDNPTNCNLWVSMFAGWNSTSNVASQYCPGPATSTTGATGTLNVFANGFASVSNVLNVQLVAALTINTMPNVANGPYTGMTYWYSVTIDRVVVLLMNTYSQVSNAVYCGMYDSFNPLTLDTYPLVCTYMGSPAPNPGTGSGRFGFTINEFPATTKGSANSIQGNFNAFPGGPWAFVSASNDVYTRASAARLLVYARYTGTTNQSGFRGLFKDIYMVGTGVALQGTGEINYFVTPSGVSMNMFSLSTLTTTTPTNYSAAPVGPYCLTI